MPFVSHAYEFSVTHWRHPAPAFFHKTLPMSINVHRQCRAGPTSSLPRRYTKFSAGLLPGLARAAGGRAWS
jgi:hypothetical protein